MYKYLDIYEPPVFYEQVEEVETEDDITAEIENRIKRKLLNNDIFLRETAKKIVELLDTHTGSAEIHVTTEKTEIWDAKADNVLATQAQNGQMSPADKIKLDSIAANAEVNQYAINNIRIGNTNVYSNAKEGQIILVPGSNVAISADNATKVISISANVPPPPVSLPANGGHADTCDRACNSNWADGATNANNAGAVRGFPFAVAIQAGAPGDGNALWILTT